MSTDPSKEETKPPRPPAPAAAAAGAAAPTASSPAPTSGQWLSTEDHIPHPILQPAVKQTGASALAGALNGGGGGGGGHKRNVSWGALTRTLQQPELGPGTSTTAPSGRINQEDLAARLPMETEAESHVISSLETRDPTTGAPSQKSVMSNITDNDLQAMNSHDSAASANSFRSIRSRGAGAKKNAFLKVANTVRSQHKRKETVGDKLQGLAAAMESLHNAHLDFLDDDPPQDVFMNGNNSNNDAKQPSSSADAFYHNTNLMYKRAASTKNVKAELDSSVHSHASAYLSSTPAEIAASKGKAAEKRWKLLKHAVAATGGAGVANDDNGGDDEAPAGTHTATIPEGSDDDDQGNQGPNRQESKDSEHKIHGRYKTKEGKFLRDLQDFVTPRSSSTWYFFKIVIFFIMLPSTGIAFILFYLAGNPPTGIVDLARSKDGVLYNEDGEIISDDTASASWWLMFLGVRQMSVVLLAKLLEIFLIDFLSVRSKFSVKVFGPWATLFILQTKGWPFLCLAWGLLSVGLFSGTKKFFHHWGYWQDVIDIFNENNPSGEVVDSLWFHRITAIAIALGAIVSMKRFWLGLYLGRQTFAQFSDKLAGVMQKILLISEVASLGRAFERYADAHQNQSRRVVSVTSYGVNTESLQGMISSVPASETASHADEAANVDTEDATYVIDPEDRHPMTGQLTMVQKERIINLLGAWSEPTLAEKKTDGLPTVNEILQFRRALEYLHTAYPFSGSFGLADRRESTIESAQDVYSRLLLRSPDPNVLHFDVIALLGVSASGKLDTDKLKDLIKLFRPDRDGAMECVDFVKSIDEVYKTLRLLRASVANSSKIDRAFERIFNFVFYAIVFCLILSQLGYDPLALFLSISGVILAFAFMIGSASSKYFEGLLFIIVRRPYQIGDGIALSGVNDQVAFTGSPMWIVEDVDLFSTNIVFSFTGEKATVNNGALASSRVINASISKEAALYVMIKFPIEVSYNQLTVFREQLKEFFKNRPREWIAFTRFRSTRFEINEGFVEYIICAQHRLPWSNFGDLQQSKADLMHFCFELQKQMNLLFKQPTQPVDVKLLNGGAENIPKTPMSPYQAPDSPGVRPPGAGSMTSNEFAALQNMFAPKGDTS